MIRLDRFLANAGEGTRTQVHALIRKGSVTVNQETVKNPAMKINPDEDIILCRDKQIDAAGPVWIMLHKPAGYVTAVTDRHQKTVMDLLREETVRDLFPAGRLDIDTTGLLLVTNDGPTAHRLLSPAHHADKVYLADLDKPVDEIHVKSFLEGIDIGDDKKTLPALLEPAPDGDHPCRVKVTVREGRFHQIKRMFAALGFQVLTLKRISMGPVGLDESLAPGEYRKLTEEEIKELLEYVCCH